MGTFLNRVQTDRISLKQAAPWLPWKPCDCWGINIAQAMWLWSRKKMYVLLKKKKGLAQNLGNPIIRSILILTVSKDPTPTSV